MKRCTVLLTLILVISLLAACGAKKDTKNTGSPEPVGTTSSGDYPKIIKSGESVTTDLNGDGKDDTVTCEPYNTADEGRIKNLTVNGAQFAKVVCDQGFKMDTPLEDYYAIVDIDTTDKYLEIAVMDYGPSDDCVTDFFRYDGETLKYLGNVNGLIRGDDGVSDLNFNGNGVISSFLRLGVFQTWYAGVDWKLGENGFAVVPQDIYYSNMENGTAVSTKVAVPVYADKNASSEKTVLPVGSSLTILGTDNAEWVLAEDASGSQCWLHLSTSDGFSVETEDGFKNTSEVFDGLCMAD